MPWRNRPGTHTLQSHLVGSSCGPRPPADDDTVKTEFVVNPCCRGINLLSRSAFECDPAIILRAIFWEAEHLNEALSELARSVTHKEERSRLREHSLT